MLITVSRRQFAQCVSVGSGSISAKKKTPKETPFPSDLRAITLDMLTTVTAPEITLHQACWCASWSFHLHGTHTHAHTLSGEKKITNER